MNESHIIEFKESWRDEYIKWISGFANAQGGTLVIGKSDGGKIVGVADVRRLLEEIPNKIRDLLGIMVDVNFKIQGKLEYLEIVVEPYPYPVSYKGQYFYRSGSTKQELKGAALDAFILRKQGKHWDGVPVPRVAVADLKKDLLNYFRNAAVNRNRLSKEIIEENDKHLLDKLLLIEGNYLKRAAILLFHRDPEKFVTGAYTKIGRFKTDSDLLFQNEIHGPLFEQVEQIMDLLLTKYLAAEIAYKGIHRTEQYLYPEGALREVVLNAVAHKDYSSGVPIQISVYDDKLYIWNDGRLPENWTVKDLLRKHPSRPYNPLIANAFFRAGLVESWGRGIDKVLKECATIGARKPKFDYSDSGLMVEFFARQTGVNIIGKVSGSGLVDGLVDGLVENQKNILTFMKQNPTVSKKELADKIGISSTAIDKNISQLKKKNLISRIGPDKGGHWEVTQ